MSLNFQDLRSFRLPPGFRGRPSWYVQVWWVVEGTLFRLSPQFMYGWRRWLLRCFGASVGSDVLVRPSARVTFPWKVTLGDCAWIGDDVVLYSLAEIEVGESAVISQRSYICTGSHNYNRLGFDIYAKKIVIEAEAWIATDVFIAPGVTVGRGAVVGARSSVFSDLPSGMISIGNPARPIKPRESEQAS